MIISEIEFETPQDYSRALKILTELYDAHPPVPPSRDHVITTVVISKEELSRVLTAKGVRHKEAVTTSVKLK